jgi:hypothetical protein
VRANFRQWCDWNFGTVEIGLNLYLFHNFVLSGIKSKSKSVFENWRTIESSSFSEIAGTRGRKSMPTLQTGFKTHAAPRRAARPTNAA